MNVCKVPDMCKDMEYKYITEDSKTRVYLSVVREFNEAEYEKYNPFYCKSFEVCTSSPGKHDSLQYAFK